MPEKFEPQRGEGAKVEWEKGGGSREQEPSVVENF
jgi:hypothetical protein